MEQYYWSNWYSNWGWFLWYGLVFLIFSGFGNWGYTYRIHRKYGDDSQRKAIDILNERYARGEIERDEFHRIKSEIKSEVQSTSSNPTISKKKSPALF